MPKNQTVLQVFVASPGDVQDERVAVREVIDELNATWAANTEIRFEVVSWETHAIPGMGDSAQSVINDGIPDDIDVFVGILWTRFGTPTREADSGTEEEFLRAFARYQADQNSVEIMFYFKDEPVSPSKMDSGQLEKISGFRAKIKDLGLYWDFTTTEHFKTDLRAHLGRILQKRTGIKQSTSSDVDEPDKAENQSEEEMIDGPEFLDLAADAEEAMDKVTSVLENLQVFIEELGAKINSRTAEIGNMVGTEAHTARNTRKAINLAASDLEQFSRSTDQELPVLRENLKMSLEVMADATFKGVESGLNDANETIQLRDNVGDFESSIKDTMDSMHSFRETINDLPSLTSKFNRARRSSLRTMDQLMSELEVGHRTASEVKTSIQKKINDAD